jgi:hypothetical protein
MGGGDWTGLRYGPSWAAACNTAADRRKSQGGVEVLPQMGLAQLERKLLFLFFFLHFPNLIFNAKTFPRNPRKCFKAQKILRKFQKFQENSQS